VGNCLADNGLTEIVVACVVAYLFDLPDFLKYAYMSSMPNKAMALASFFLSIAVHAND
jgi:hypothetical protein